MNDTSEIMRQSFYDSKNCLLFTDVIRFQTSGKLRAEYQDRNGNVLCVEKICLKKLSSEASAPDKIDRFVQEHLAQVTETVRQLNLANFPLKEFVRLRMCKKVDATDYVRLLKNRICYDIHFKENIPHNMGNDVPPNWRSENEIISDYDEPLEATYAKLLLVNFYKSKIRLPNLRDFTHNFYEMRTKRSQFINSLIGDNYQLYSDGKLIFEKKEGKRVVYNHSVFEKVCQKPFENVYFPRSKKPWQEFIDDTFIEKYIPKECRDKIKKSFKGMTFEEALNKRGLYGDIKTKKIRKTEISRLSSPDQYLFSGIRALSAKQWDSWNNSYREYPSMKENNCTELKKAYPFLSEYPWSKITKIYQYFAGQKNKIPLISDENKEGLIAITKMFLTATTLINLDRTKGKITFGDRPYQFLLKIIQMSPGLSTAEVFSKTLHYRKFSNKEKEAYLLNPKNWMDERIGRWAISVANQSVLADTLCRRIQQREVDHPIGIIAVTGNSGSGKSYALGDEPGTLNPDSIKYILRIFSSMTSDQVHEEGAKYIFKHLFNEVENSQEVLIVDKRFKNRETVDTYLIKPALKRNCSVFLSDCDVPLITTFNRILKRKPDSKDPILPIQAMIDGFKEIRSFRKELITMIEENKVFQKYALYHAGNLIGQKEKGQFVVQDGCEEEFAECLRPYSPDDEKCLDAIINEPYIQEAIDRKDIREEQKECLTRFLGREITLREALQEHANAKALLNPYALANVQT